MIQLPDGARLWLYSKPTDLRKGFTGLAALVHSQMGHDLLNGDLFLFIAHSRRSLKILQWDGSGLCIYTKRLASGCFAPLFKPGNLKNIQLSAQELQLLLASEDLTRDPRWRDDS